jgi:hypothetical protein
MNLHAHSQRRRTFRAAIVTLVCAGLLGLPAVPAAAVTQPDELVHARQAVWSPLTSARGGDAASDEDGAVEGTSAPTAEPEPAPLATNDAPASGEKEHGEQQSADEAVIAPRANGLPFVCSPGNIYSLDGLGTGTGVIREVNVAGGTTTAFGSFGPVTANGGDQLNALGISADGMTAFALRRIPASGSVPQRVQLLRYDVSAGYQNETVVHTFSGLNHSIVAGGVDPLTGVYWFGGRISPTGADANRYRFTSYDPATGEVRQNAFRFDLGHDAAQSDLAFDYSGNMYLLTTWGISDINRQNLWVIPKRSIDVAMSSGSDKLVAGARSLSHPQPRDRTFHSIAWGSDGYMYVASSPDSTPGKSRTLHRINPLTGAQTDLGVIANGGNITDFASCANPYTITVRKDIAARKSPSDQFRLSVSGVDVPATSGLTEGSDTGLQLDAAEVAGPVAVLPGQQYTVGEAAAGTANLANYTTSYSCVDESNPGKPVIAEGVGTSRTFAIPSGSTGANVVCTFTNVPKPDPFDEPCTPGNIYGVSANGQALLVRPDGSRIVDNGWRTLYGSWALPSHLTTGGNVGTKYGVNGVAVASDGTQYAYASAYSYDANYPETQWWPLVSILVKKPGEAWRWWDYAATPDGASYYDLANGEVPVTGAIDPASGNYLIGGFEAKAANGQARFVLRELNLTTGKSTIIGRVNVGAWNSSYTVLNGDIAFDASGNLFILSHRTGATAGVGPLTITTVPKANIDSARTNPGGMIAGNVTRAQQTTYDGGVNGIAVDPDGSLVLSSPQSMWRVDPVTAAQIGPKILSSNPFVGGSSLIDLASCSSPNTLIVRKDIVNRVKPSDQFELQLQRQDGTQVASTVTEGSSNGVQQQQVGPTLVTAGSTYRIAEVGSAGTVMGDYTSTWSCVDPQGASVASGTGTSGALTIPSNYRSSPVTCTFRNAPISPEIELIKVDASDPDSMLQGAEFQLWRDVNANGTLERAIDEKVGAAVSTSVDGTIVWDSGLVAGDYLIEEITPPQGYVMGANAVVAVTLTASREIVRIENTRRTGIVTWTKTDSDGRPLGGSEWRLETSGSTWSVTDCVGADVSACATTRDIDPREGYFRVDGLVWGDYSLVETKAPAGYVLDPTVYEFAIGIHAPSHLEMNLGDIVNERRPPLVIPLTGGLGADGFLLGGGGVLAALLLAILIRYQRRQRVRVPR